MYDPIAASLYREKNKVKRREYQAMYWRKVRRIKVRGKRKEKDVKRDEVFDLYMDQVCKENGCKWDTDEQVIKDNDGNYMYERSQE